MPIYRHSISFFRYIADPYLTATCLAHTLMGFFALEHSAPFPPTDQVTLNVCNGNICVLLLAVLAATYLTPPHPDTIQSIPYPIHYSTTVLHSSMTCYCITYPTTGSCKYQYLNSICTMIK